MRTALLLSCCLLALASPVLARARNGCIPAEQAIRHLGKTVCVKAHVYRVVDTAEGIHFLDVCSPDTPDDACRFFIVSFTSDGPSVGDLQSLLNHDITVSGKLHSIQGRADMVLSSREQLHGGKEKFTPNPALLKGYAADSGGQAFAAHNGTGGQRGVHFSHRGR
jgi:hypothetical protein